MKNQIRFLFVISIGIFLCFPATINAQKSFKQLTKLAESYYGKQSLDTAIIFEEQALLEAEKEFGKKDTNYCNSARMLLELWYFKGNYSKAIEYGLEEKGLRKNLQGEKHTDYASCLNNLALLYESKGDFNSAGVLYKEALEIKRQVVGENHPEYAISLNNFAAFHQTLGNYAAAEPLFIQALKIRKEVLGVNNPDYAGSLNNLANLYRLMGNYSAAEPLYKEAIKVFKEVLGGMHLDYAKLLNNLGVFYVTIGNYEAAEPLMIEASRINKEVRGEKHPDYANSMNILAIIYQKKGNYAAAEPLYIETLKIRKEALGEKHPDYAQSLNNVAAIYKVTGNYPAAESSYKEALKVRKEALGEKHPDYAASLQNLSFFYCVTGNYGAAEPLALEALKITKESLGEKHPSYSETLNNLAIIYRNMQQYKAAEPFCLKAVSIVNHNTKKLFSTQSEKEKELYIKTQEAFYSTFYSIAKHRKNENHTITEEVYNTALNNKGLLLQSSTAMRYRILNSKDTGLVNKYNQWGSLNKEITKLYSTEISKRPKNPEILEKQANELEKELVKSSQLFSNLEKSQNVNWQSIQKGLKPKEAAIEIIHFKEGKKEDTVTYCALIITPESQYPEMITLFEEQQLTAILGAYQGNNVEYINAVYGKQNDVNIKLYNLIWKPMEPLLKGIKTVYLSPSGFLHKVSFPAISKKKNVYLCDKYKVNVVSSTAKVALPETFSFDNTAITSIYGGVDFDGDSTQTDSYKGWNYLEGTKTESEKINATLVGSNLKANLYTGKTASEINFKNTASTNTIIHLASHGFFYPDPEQELEEQKRRSSKKDSLEQTNPKQEQLAFRGSSGGFGLWAFVKNKNPLMRSGLVLAGANDVWNVKYKTGNEEDGVLTAQEVATLDLQKTGLVVLSACETGLGDIKGSEGVYGLQRAFKMAGVKYLVMSLWQVPDKETSEFMTSFYSKLVKEKNIKTAFAATQLEMRKKYDPYFWAAFVLVE